MGDYYHAPVMIKEVLEGLKVAPGGVYIDATVGEGGHSEAMLEACQPTGRVLGIDADPSVLGVAENRLQRFGDSFQARAHNFVSLTDVAGELGYHQVQGVLFDLGLSSRQLAISARGFSFRKDGPLDMRFDSRQEITADQIINTWPEAELTQVIRSYGEEPRARRIARAIVASRPIKTTVGLANLIGKSVGRARGRIHPATRTFQAIRIAVNRELDSVKEALGRALELLSSGGRLVVITYHSLEAVIVKAFLRREAKGCDCPPELPVCVCGRTPRMRRITKKAIGPSKEERVANPRCRSAWLRVGERV